MGSTVLSRRAAVRGAVWSLPAVTVATTAPAFANTSGADGADRLRQRRTSPDQPEQVVISATASPGFDASYQLPSRCRHRRASTSVGSVAVVAGAPGRGADGRAAPCSFTYPVTAGSFTRDARPRSTDDLAGQFRGYRGDETILRRGRRALGVRPGAACRWPTCLRRGRAGQCARPRGRPTPQCASRRPACGCTADAPQPSVGRLRRRRQRFPPATYANANPPAVSNLAPGWMVDPRRAPYEAAGGWLMPLRHHAGGTTRR